MQTNYEEGAQPSTGVELETGDLRALRRALKKKCSKKASGEEVWQSILNLGYVKWQKPELCSGWSYRDMVDWVGLEYGSFAKLCILMGKYNQQVLNGGHGQYFDNGYAGGDPGRPDEGLPLHYEMMRLMELIGVDQLPLGAKVYDIMDRFTSSMHNVDDAYAEIHEEWMSSFGNLIRSIITEES